jgi:hypothetical protein
LECGESLPLLVKKKRKESGEDSPHSKGPADFRVFAIRLT